jgi:hypothetical protein
VYVERFGDKYLTVLNDSPERRSVVITLDRKAPEAARELLSGRRIEWRDGRISVALDGEDVAALEIQ